MCKSRCDRAGHPDGERPPPTPPSDESHIARHVAIARHDQSAIREIHAAGVRWAEKFIIEEVAFGIHKLKVSVWRVSARS